MAISDRQASSKGARRAASEKKDASVKLRFGYDYPDKWRWDVTSTDNGRDWESIETQKMLSFEAKANF